MCFQATWPRIPWWSATSSPVSLAALRSSRAIRGTSQPLDSRHRRKVSLVTSVNARVLAYQGTLPGRPRAPVRSGSLLRNHYPMPGTCSGLVRGGAARARVKGRTVRPRSRIVHATGLDSSQPSGSGRRERHVAPAVPGARACWRVAHRLAAKAFHWRERPQAGPAVPSHSWAGPLGICPRLLATCPDRDRYARHLHPEEAA